MKKIVLSLATVAAMSSFAVAGGDIAPAPVAQPDNSGIYLGIGYAAASVDFSNFAAENGDRDEWDGGVDTDASAGLFIVGYQYNEYLSFEARWTHYTTKADFYDSDDDDLDLELSIDNIGLYLKPQYTFGNVTAYALIGYGWTRMNLDLDEMNNGSAEFDDTQGAFQWGAGASFALSEHTNIFVDYTSLGNGLDYSDSFDGTEVSFDADAYTINVGITYRF